MRGGVQLAVRRWLHDPFYQRVFRGHMGDFGGACDPFADVRSFFPAVTSLVTVDLLSGPNLESEAIVTDLNTWNPKPSAYDCILSSHCLEHLDDPIDAFRHWEIGLKPGGHLIVVVPSWDTYERGAWPSRWNPDHRSSWVMQHPRLSHQRALLDLPHRTTVVRALTLDEGFRDEPDAHQTLEGSCECGLELVTIA